MIMTMIANPSVARPIAIGVGIKAGNGIIDTDDRGRKVILHAQKNGIIGPREGHGAAHRDAQTIGLHQERDIVLEVGHHAMSAAIRLNLLPLNAIETNLLQGLPLEDVLPRYLHDADMTRMNELHALLPCLGMPVQWKTIELIGLGP